MILASRNITPFISFGFGRVKKTVYTDEVVKIFLENVYNFSDGYIIVLASGGELINNNYYENIYPTAGTYNFNIEIKTPYEIDLISNTIVIEVLEHI